MLGAEALKHDLTELSGMDFLAAPTGPILKAQVGRLNCLFAMLLFQLIIASPTEL
jgi:hypothetical protein